MLGTIIIIMAKTTMMMMTVDQEGVEVEVPLVVEDAELAQGEALEVGLVLELVAAIGETAMVSWLTKRLTSKLMLSAGNGADSRMCSCGTEAVVRTAGPTSKNAGRSFHTCPKPQGQQCGFFVSLASYAWLP
jgi:hypothetical protein